MGVEEMKLVVKSQTQNKTNFKKDRTKTDKKLVSGPGHEVK